ncbi:MAG TPA: hypothetical protein VD997_02610 [Phycisphaerales bacterium]|nr:hypothetical protein [Phycisphaerales bacterium]
MSTTLTEAPAPSSPDQPSMFPGYQRERLDEAALPPGPQARWPLINRILFRFSFIYFTLYFLPFPLDHLARLQWVPGLKWLADAAAIVAGTWENGKPVYGLWDQATQAMCKWVGANVLHLPDSGAGSIIIQPTGSGDTMLKWVEAFSFLCIAAFGALVWSLIDFRRKAYPRVFSYWHIYLRFALGAILLGYGFAKFPPSQFQPPSPEKLISTYGNSSMMGLLWTFMGASPAYTMFAGLAEIIGGGLLLFRRTALIGALVCFGVMLNVFMLNMCYDVPVKLYSFHLMIAAALIAMPFASRLVCVTLLNRPTTPCSLWWPSCNMWQKWSFRGVHALAVILILGMGCYGSYYSWKRYLNPPPKPPLAGLYKVTSITLNGTPARELPDERRWRRVSFTRWGTMLVENYTDQRDSVGFKLSDADKTLTLTPKGQMYQLELITNDDGTLTIDGPYTGGMLKATLTKVPDDSFLIKSRGFNWIQEMPFNR